MINAQALAHLKAIPEGEWVLIYKDLVLFATYKLKELGFAIRNEPDVMLSEDLAQEAIAKIFEGTRTWDTERFPDLRIHLKQVVRSLIANQAKKSRNAVVTQANVRYTGDDDEPDTLEAINAEDPETLLINQQFWRQLEMAFGDKEEEFLIFSEWVDLEPPREIALTYSTTREEVYRIVKKGRKIISLIVKGE
jgi:DNA-directed RNA polymerase specialized sigma24 family protein